MLSVDILVDLLRGDLKQRGVGDEAVNELEGRGIVVPVNGALVEDELAVNILALDDVAVAVELVNMALCTEGDEHGQGAEVIDMVIDGADAERAEVGYYHRAVEGADIEQSLRQQAEIIRDANEPDEKAYYDAGQRGEFIRKFLGAVFLVGAFDGVDRLVHLIINIIDGVGRLKGHLDGRFGRVYGKTALDGHDYLDIVMRIDAVADDEAVETGKVCAGADISRNEKMQHAYALVAVNALLSEPAVGVCYLKRLLVIIERIVSCGHYKRNEVIKSVERAQPSAVNAVSGAALVVVCHMKPPLQLYLRGLYKIGIYISSHYTLQGAILQEQNRI